MLSIGEFSRICEVTPKTLRYYEEIGLLYPEKINQESGYRYYSIKQLEKMLLINRLKSYKIPLDEIKAIISQEKIPEEEQLFAPSAIKKHIAQSSRQNKYYPSSDRI